MKLGGRKIYIFYVDLYLIRNVFMNIMILLLMVQVMRFNLRNKMIRVILSGILGSFFSIFILLATKNYFLYLIGAFVIITPIMCLLVVGKKGDILFRAVIISYGISAMMAGGTEAVRNIAEIKEISISAVLFSIIFSEAVISIIVTEKKERKNLFQVDLMNKSYSLSVSALYDTGNRLKEPYQNRVVHIADEKILEELHVEPYPLYVPFKSLGTSTGVIKAYEIDKMIVRSDKKKIICEGPVIGIAGDDLLKDKKYKLILNEGICE